MAPVTDSDISTLDLYELLAIAPTASESEIRRAYRKTSLLYHPDKVTPTPETLDKFQLLQQALQVLTDPTERSKYDFGREAKLRRAAESQAMEDKRRKMKEDLEKRETGMTMPATVNGVKRTWTDRELQIKRIADENRRKMEAASAKRMEEVKRAEVPTETPTESVQRSVKVRWIKEGDGLDIDSEALLEIFPAGEVEDVLVLKDKKRKVEGKDKKVVMGTAVLVFKSLAAAKKVVARGRTDELESVTWAMEKEKEPEPA